VRFYPASNARFFARIVDAEVTFDKDSMSGAITQLTLHQDGKMRIAPIVSASGTPATRPNPAKSGGTTN
jgi:hypothetical protein